MELVKPHDLIVVEGVEGVNIVVRLVDDELLLTIGGKSKRYAADKFRCFTFIDCGKCDVYILVKTTKILFAFCDEMKVSIRRDALGVLEIYRCEKVDVENMGKIPLFSVEESIQVNFFQDASPQKYLVSASEARAITSSLIGTPASFRSDPQYNISNMFEEQKIFTVSSEEYSTSLYKDVLRKRDPPNESKGIPIKLKTGREYP